MRPRQLAVALGACLIAAGCSHPATTTDPNVSACEKWSVAYHTLSDSLAMWKGGYDPTVDAAEHREQAVIADVLPQTSGDVRTALVDLQAQWATAASSDGKDLGTAEYVMSLTCDTLVKAG